MADWGGLVGAFLDQPSQLTVTVRVFGTFDGGDSEAVLAAVRAAAFAQPSFFALGKHKDEIAEAIGARVTITAFTVPPEDMKELQRVAMEAAIKKMRG
jgi:hypothetical protein